MIIKSPGVLKWYNSTDEQHHNKSYTYGDYAPIVCPIGQIPPFQFMIETTSNLIDVSAKLVDPETGTEYAFSSTAMIGITKTTKTGYDLIEYPSVALVAGLPIVSGKYYCQITVGSNTYYSEVFQMCTDVSDLWRLEFCHSGNFEIDSNGLAIDYADNFKMFLYFDAEIGKPIWQYEEEVEERDGLKFPIQQIAYKQSRFQLILPEETLDALSIVPLHDFVKLTKGTKTIELDELIVTAEWEERGDLAKVECEIRTDKVVVVNGRGVASGSCDVAAGGCVPVDHTAVARILENSAEYNGDYYVSVETGANVSFADDDIVLIEDDTTGDVLAYTFSGGTYTLLADVDPGEWVYDSNAGRYYFDNAGSGLETYALTGYTGTTANGTAPQSGTVELYGLLYTGDEILLATDDNTGFELDGIDFTVYDGMKAIRIKVSNVICQHFYISDWVFFNWDDFITIQGEYASDELAIAGGVTAGQYYELSIDNMYGLQRGVVKRIPDFVSFFSDQHGLDNFGNDCVFQLATLNIQGYPSGICRMVANTTPVYNNDIDADANGVAIGELYVLNDYNQGQFIKVRKELTG